MISLHHEPMSPVFDKYHLDGIPGRPVLHRFRAPDLGSPHDHPWGFFSFIVSGGYVEEVFDRTTGASSYVRHEPGSSFHVPATHIHRIVELLADEVWTMILPGPWEQKSGFWEFRADGPYYRAWDEPEFGRV